MIVWDGTLGSLQRDTFLEIATLAIPVFGGYSMVLVGTAIPRWQFKPHVNDQRWVGRAISGRAGVADYSSVTGIQTMSESDKELADRKTQNGSR